MCMMQSFLEAVGGRGMGALELVAMDMKARGMYVCRTLSFSGLLLPNHQKERKKERRQQEGVDGYAAPAPQYTLLYRQWRSEGFEQSFCLCLWWV